MASQDEDIAAGNNDPFDTRDTFPSGRQPKTPAQKKLLEATKAGPAYQTGPFAGVNSEKRMERESSTRGVPHQRDLHKDSLQIRVRKIYESSKEGKE